MSRRAAQHVSARKEHEAALNRVAALRVKVSQAHTRRQIGELQQAKVAAVRQNRTQEELALAEAAEKKKRLLQQKAEHHAAVVAAGDNRKERVAEVLQRKHLMGEEGRKFRSHADEVVHHRAEAISNYNHEMAQYVRQSRVGVSVSQDKIRQRAINCAAESKQLSEQNAQRAKQIREVVKQDKTKKKEKVLGSRDGARHAAARVKAKNDALGAEERQRIAEEEARIQAYREHETQYRHALHDEVMSQANIASERQRAVVEAKRAKAVAERATLAKQVEDRAAQKAASQLQRAQKTSQLKESRSTVRMAKEKLAAEKREKVRMEMEETARSAAAFVEMAGASTQHVLAEEQYLLEQLAAMQ